MGEDSLCRGSQAPRMLNDIPELQPLLSQQRSSLLHTPEDKPRATPLASLPSAASGLTAAGSLTSPAQGTSTLLGVRTPTIPAHYRDEYLEHADDSNDRMAAYDQQLLVSPSSKNVDEEKNIKAEAMASSSSTLSTSVIKDDVSVSEQTTPALLSTEQERVKFKSNSELERATPENFGIVPAPQARASFVDGSLLSSTPTALGAYRSASSERVTEIAGLPARKRAASRTPLLVLLLGGLAVLIAKYGPPLLQEVEDEKSAVDVIEQKNSTVQASSLSAIELTELETRFLAILLQAELADSGEKKKKLEVADEGLKRDAQAALTLFQANSTRNKLENSNVTLNSQEQAFLIRLLRLSGNWEASYQKLQATSTELKDPFLGPFLDLADPHQPPNYESLIRRFREAAIGEGSPYLLSVAAIYCLIQADKITLAKVELSKLELKTNYDELKDSELFELLHVLISKRLRAQAVSKRSTERERTQSVKPEKSLTKAQETMPSVTLEKQPKVSPPAPIIEARRITAQADHLWNIGQQQESLTLYKQVLQLVGSDHYLGQRASSRIRRESK